MRCVWERLGPVAAVLLVGSSLAFADSIEVDSSFWSGPSAARTTNSGITALGNWSPSEGGLKLSWDISESAGVYTYSYTFQNWTVPRSVRASAISSLR